MFWLLFACSGEERLEHIQETHDAGLTEEREINLLYSSALIGEIEPCG